MYLRNGRVGVFDLSKGELDEQELQEGDNLESLKIAERLSSANGPDALVLGTGALTGSFVPASCAGFISAKNGFAPILGFAGVELKLSGFDFIVLKGRSEKRGYIWIRDGIVEFVESDTISTLDAWKRTDKIRGDQGDGKIQVLSIGPWGDLAKPAAQFVTNYWGGEDKIGMGAELGRRNISAIAFRGMGELEIKEPEKHFEDSVLLMSEHIQRLGKSDGLASYSSVASRDDLKKIMHRVVACYGCPFPCRSYVKVFEDAGELRIVTKEPGYLHYDIPALDKAYAVGFDAKDGTHAILKCAKAGVEPVSALSALSAPTLDAIDQLLSDPSDTPNAHPMNFESSLKNAQDYSRAIGLGVCPRYWAKVGFDFKAVAAYAESALDLKPI